MNRTPLILFLLGFLLAGCLVPPQSNQPRMADDLTIEELRPRVEEAIPKLKSLRLRLQAVHAELTAERDHVPENLRTSYASQVDDLKGDLENAQTWLQMVEREPLNPLSLSAACVTLHKARIDALRWSAVLARRNNHLQEFVLSEIRSPRESEDPLVDLMAVLGEVAMTRDAQVKRSRR